MPEGKHGKGELKYINGVPVLTVEGTPEEIGEQVGVLAFKPVPQMAGLIKEYLKSRGLEKAWTVLAKAANGMALQFPPDHLKELEAAAKASGQDRDVLLFTNTIPDLIKVGCSTIVVEPSRSTTGKLLFGRNLDVPPVANVHEFSLVTIYRTKGKHAFASVGLPGMFGCNSGLNDAGLALAMNSSYETADGANEFDPKGTPTILAFRRILEECATVEEAEKLLRSLKRTTICCLTVCDKKEGAVFEITPKSLVVRRGEQGLCFCTNHFRTKELAVQTECRRYETLEKERDRKMLGLDDVARDLHAVNQGAATIQTMIFEPTALKLHVALGKGPSSGLPLKLLELEPLFKK